MVSEKVVRYQNLDWNLKDLAGKISGQLTTDGYKTQQKDSAIGTVIQAQKAGILRDIITADRCFTVLISGQPNDFTIHVGIGRWVQNIAVAAVETLFISVLFLAVDIPEMLWTNEVEKQIVREIDLVVKRVPLQQTAA